LVPRVANWLPKFNGILFSSLGGQYKPIAFLSNLGHIEKAFTPSVKPLGLISSLAPIGMLDLGFHIRAHS
jgi:hypothetical protein